jgi:hypothetical protein
MHSTRDTRKLRIGADSKQIQGSKCAAWAVFKFTSIATASRDLGDCSALVDVACRTLQNLSSTLDGLSKQSTLKKILWRGGIASRIATAYRDLRQAIDLFNVSP